MKRIALVLFALIFLVGCGAKGNDSSDKASTSSRYIDADVDFTGKVTIVGRWKCMSETQNGETRDASVDEIYYVFSSDGTMDAFYAGAEMIDYSGYTYNGSTVTMRHSGGEVTLNCEITETELKLSSPDGRIETVYKRVKYE